MTAASPGQWERLLGIMDTLLGECGCPWDRVQTHTSLIGNMEEECREVIDAIHKGDIDNLKEELGDVLLQVVFHSKIAEKNGDFSIGDVIETLSTKLTARHTHVFGSDVAATPEDALDVWKRNKKVVR